MTEFDIKLRSDGIQYEVLEIYNERIQPDQLSVGEFLSDSNVDDLVHLGIEIKFVESH
jgi:hypothetical protein